MSNLILAGTKTAGYGSVGVDIDPSTSRIYTLLGLTDANGGRVELRYSDDTGVTWTNAGTVFSTARAGGYSNMSLSVDADGYIHMAATEAAGGQVLATMWSRSFAKSSTLILSNNGSVTFGSTIVGCANPNRLGERIQFVAYTLHDSGSNQRIVQVYRTRRSETPGSTDSFAFISAHPTNAAGLHPLPVLALNHTGDGRTFNSAAPYFHMLHNTISGGSVYKQVTRYARGAGDGWAFNSSILLPDVVTDGNSSVHNSIFNDGDRLVVAYRINTTRRIRVYQLSDEAAMQLSDISPPDDCPVVPEMVSVAYDSSDNVVIVARGASTIYTDVFNRKTFTWQGWNLIESGLTAGSTPLITTQPFAQGNRAQVAFTHGSAPTETRHLRISFNRPPNVPTLTSPPAGSILDLAAGAEFRWRFSDPDSDGAQGAWAFRRKIGTGAPEWWNHGTLAWTNSEYWNPGTGNTVGFPAGRWSNGTEYDWSVATKDTNDEASPYSGWRRVVGSTPPTTTVTAPTDPVTNTVRPTVTASYTDPDGATDSKTAHEVRVFASSTYSSSEFNPTTSTPVWESGLVTTPAAISETVQTPLDNGGTYRAYVRVYKKNQSSAWAYRQFSLSLTAPPNPSSVNVSSIKNPTTGITGLRVVVTGGHDPLVFDETRALIRRRIVGTSEWTDVGEYPYDATPSVTVDDYSPIPGTQYEYQARTHAEVD